MSKVFPSQLRIAMISYYYYPEYSGSAKQATSLIQTLRKKNIQSFVIAARLKPEWPAYEIIDNIEIFRIPVKGRHSLISFWISLAVILWKKRNDYDIVHSHGMNPFHGFPLFFAKLLGKPSLGKLSIANSDIDFNNQGRIIGRLHRIFLSVADRYIAISTALQNELASSGLSSAKCMYIPNGVDTTRFKPPASKSMPGDNGPVRVLFVGVIDYRKGIDVLIPAFSESINKGIKAELLLVGPRNRDDEGDRFFKSMQQLAADLNARMYIRFSDYSDDIVGHFQSADLMVLPSRQEGMPNVVIEAMACQLPVIATKISGSEDLVKDHVNGYVVEPGNETELSDALYNLLSKPELMQKMGEESVKLVKKYYSLDQVADQYMMIYKEILST